MTDRPSDLPWSLSSSPLQQSLTRSVIATCRRAPAAVALWPLRVLLRVLPGIDEQS